MRDYDNEIDIEARDSAFLAALVRADRTGRMASVLDQVTAAKKAALRRADEIAREMRQFPTIHPDDVPRVRRAVAVVAYLQENARRLRSRSGEGLIAVEAMLKIADGSAAFRLDDIDPMVPRTAAPTDPPPEVVPLKPEPLRAMSYSNLVGVGECSGCRRRTKLRFVYGGANDDFLLCEACGDETDKRNYDAAKAAG